MLRAQYMISKSKVGGIWKRSKFMARRFASSTEQEIETFLKQKDSENKSVQKPEDKKDTNVEIV